jgi:hypothetical protein
LANAHYEPKIHQSTLEKTENFSKNLHQEVLYLNMQDDDWITETGMKTDERNVCQYETYLQNRASSKAMEKKLGTLIF